MYSLPLSGMRLSLLTRYYQYNKHLRVALAELRCVMLFKFCAGLLGISVAPAPPYLCEFSFTTSLK